jgi:hypothetical protein
MRPTWKAETIVAPFAKVSGSTSVWWFVVLEPLHVACVNGSELTGNTAASAAAAAESVSAAVSATPNATRRGDGARSDTSIYVFFLLDDDQGGERLGPAAHRSATLLRRFGACMSAA